MKTAVSSILLFLVLSGCQNPTNTETPINQINFTTDRTNYSKSDSINIILDNKSDSEFLIGLRCNTYLEMFYQKKENNVWSDDLWLWYMSFRCPTAIDTVEPNNIFNFFIKSEMLDSSGTYRFVLRYHSMENVEAIKYSNSFVIK